MENEIQNMDAGKSPAELILSVASSGGNLESLEKLLEIQMKWEKNQSRKAYHQAMAKFKEESPTVTKNKTNKQYDSKYTTLGNLVNTVNPILSKYGLSASWDVMQNGNIIVTCKLTHCLGHSESSSMLADADSSGAKNKIQQIKSTITYLKGVTFESICGLASSDVNVDDDGNGANEAVEYITEDQIERLEAELKVLGKSKEKFLIFMGVTEFNEIPKEDYGKALKAIEACKAKVVKK